MSNTDTLPPALAPAFVIPLEKNGPCQGISEGWYYSDHEKAIHGYSTHNGIDFAAPRGTPVFAAANGFAVSSYHTGYARLKVDEHTYKPIFFERKRVGFGLGLFIQIWHPQVQVYTAYGHLEAVAKNVLFVPPTAQEETWQPTVVYQPVKDFLSSAQEVKQGDLLGYIGDTGLSWGYEECPVEAPHRPDPQRFASWDETHLHFEVYTRTADGKQKEYRYDPFAIYGRVEDYAGILTSRAGGLWLADAEGKLRFAR